ncbi:MAG: MFS transporter [Bacillota bacterium]
MAKENLKEQRAMDFGKCEKDSPDYIPPKEKLSYGLGSLMDGGGVALISCIMLNYMTNALGIAMGVAATIMMISKAWDAISDPLMGIISDGTRSKWGRRKPFMFVGGFFLIIALFLLLLPLNNFNISTLGKSIYILVMFLFWNTCSTITQVPYTSMASDISPDFRERNNANTVKLIFTAVSSGIAYVVPLLLLEAYTAPESSFLPPISGTQFWLITAGIFGFLFGGGLIQAGIFVKERIKPVQNQKKERYNLNTYLQPFKNKSFRWHIAMYVTAYMCMDIVAALAVYYAVDVWRGAELFGMSFSSMFIIAPVMVAAVIAFPLVRIIMDKKDKQYAFRMGLPMYILSGIMLAIMDPYWAPSILVPIVALLMGFGFGGAQMMPWIIFPDTVDVAELKQGIRPTGNYSGIMTLVRKLAGAMGVWVIGSILGVVGYVESTSDFTVIQSDSVLITIRFLLGGSIAVLISLALVASFRYKVNSYKLSRIRYFIERKRNKTLVSMPEEEKQERLQLVEELAGLNDDERKAFIAEMYE